MNNLKFETADVLLQMSEKLEVYDKAPKKNKRSSITLDDVLVDVDKFNKFDRILKTKGVNLLVLYNMITSFSGNKPEAVTILRLLKSTDYATDADCDALGIY